MFIARSATFASVRHHPEPCLEVFAIAPTVEFVSSRPVLVAACVPVECVDPRPEFDVPFPPVLWWEAGSMSFGEEGRGLSLCFIVMFRVVSSTALQRLGIEDYVAHSHIPYTNLLIHIITQRRLHIIMNHPTIIVPVTVAT